MPLRPLLRPRWTQGRCALSLHVQAALNLLQISLVWEVQGSHCRWVGACRVLWPPRCIPAGNPTLQPRPGDEMWAGCPQSALGLSAFCS